MAAEEDYQQTGAENAAANPAVFAADYPPALVRPSPNFGERQGGKAVSMLIIHYTNMETAAAAEQLLADPLSELSAHYLLREDGIIVQMVAEEKRAWHAGRSFWAGETDINSRSVGIEVANKGDVPYPKAQIAALIGLAKNIIDRYAIKPQYVLAHSDIAPERKDDPGALFPWGELAQAGIGHYAPPAPMQAGQIMGAGASGPPVAAFQSMLALYGYNISPSGCFDAQTECVTRAFQRHFRPQKIDGLADISTIATLHSLLSSLPEA